MIIQIDPKKIVFAKSIQGLCVLSYRSHKRGCPNFGKRETCPPRLPLIDRVLNFSRPVYLIWSEFDLGAYIEERRRKFPDYSDYQLANVLCWQGRLRKNHREYAAEMASKHGFSVIDHCPEGHGVDMTELFRSCAGIELDWNWPLKKITRVASLAGWPKRRQR